jgi:glutathione S-transferase
MLLEEKCIPYRVEKINMRSYGDKPQSFLRKGDLPLHNRVFRMQ